MLGLIKVMINRVIFVQLICLDLPHLPSSAMDTSNVVEIANHK